MCYNIIEDKKMKLNSVELKKLILEVMEEAKRRDFLRGAVGLGALAALGRPASDLYDKDSLEGSELTREDVIEMGMDPAEFGFERNDEWRPNRNREQFPLDPVEEPDPNGWRERAPTHSKSEGKVALDNLRFTPEDREFYSVSPAQGSDGQAYAYVDIGGVFDMADADSEIARSIEVSEGFFSDFTIKQHFEYVFGSLTFWGTYRDPDNPNNMQLAPKIKGLDRWDREIDISILPLAWTVSLEHWTNRFSSLEARLQQYPNKRREILSEAGLNDREYQEMKRAYENIINRLSSGAVVPNPKYNP